MKKMLRKKEEGAVMVFVALLMVVLLAFTALAIDFGTAYYQRQKLQTACDAAALAGVQYLPNTTKAETVAREYLAANFEHGVTTSVEFLDSNQKIRVTADFKSATTFGQILGSKNIDVTTRAAAGTKTITKSNGEFPYLLYSQGDLKMNLGGKAHINGAVHANGAVEYQCQDGEGAVGQISAGGAVKISSGDIYVGSGDDKLRYSIYKWTGSSFQKVSASTTEFDSDISSGNISDYYLIPVGTFYTASGSPVNSWNINSSNMNDTYYADSARTKESPIYPLSAVTDVVKKEKFTDWDNDAPLKTIKNLQKQCEDKIDDIVSGYVHAQADLAGHPGTAQSDSYIETSHSDSGKVKINTINNDSKYHTISGTVTQNASRIDVEGPGQQKLQIAGSGKLKINDILFNSTSLNNKNNNTVLVVDDSGSGGGSSSDGNGLYVNPSVKVETGNIYSYGSLGVGRYSDDPTTFVINGDVYCDGNLCIEGCTVNGNIFATGSISIKNCAINGFLGADGNISYTGVPSSAVAYTESNPNTLAVYSRNKNVNFIAANGNPPQYVAGIVLAMKGHASLFGDFKFYGNVIADEITDTAGSAWEAYPLSALPNYKDIKDKVINGGGGSPITETTYVLVE